MYLPINDSSALVVNQFSGAVVIVDESWFNSLEIKWPDGRFRPETLPERYPDVEQSGYGRLLDRLGFTLTRDKHSNYLEQLRDFGRRFQTERQTTFFVTPQTQKKGCPLGCVYCFQKEAVPELELLLEPGGVENIVAYIRRYQEMAKLADHSVCLQLFGGEPVQDRFYDFWKQILTAVRQNGWRWGVVTSGATFTPRMFNLFERFADAGLQEFNITMDGAQPVHDGLRPFKGGGGTHEQIAANVEELLRRDLPVLIKTNIGKDNIGSFRDHLRNVVDRGWPRGNFVLMVNVIQEFGRLNTREQVIDEDEIMLSVIDLFRQEEFSWLIPYLRLEGKKLTGYLANAFGLPVRGTERLRRGKPVFDAYPYHSFCNPRKGVSWNIAPNGYLRSCNWMAGHRDFGEGSIFDSVTPRVLSRYSGNVIDHPVCSGCDISTLCGGGCAIDTAIDSEYHTKCRRQYGEVISSFVQGCLDRGWLDPTLVGEPIKVLREGFDLSYVYRDRSDPERRISDLSMLRL